MTEAVTAANLLDDLALRHGIRSTLEVIACQFPALRCPAGPQLRVFRVIKCAKHITNLLSFEQLRSRAAPLHNKPHVAVKCLLHEIASEESMFLRSTLAHIYARAAALQS